MHLEQLEAYLDEVQEQALTIVQMAVMAGMTVGLHWAQMTILRDCLHTAEKTFCNTDTNMTSNLDRILVASLCLYVQLWEAHAVSEVDMQQCCLSSSLCQ